MKNLSKKRILISAAIVLACAIGCGVWYYFGHTSSDPVYVYPFQYIGMTEYWGDSQESYGPVSTDKIQTVFLSDTQTVTEICVQEGDAVKKGDLLMTFDTTLSDLALERKRLEVEKLKLQQQDAEKQLREINSMKPMEVPEFNPPEPDDPNMGDYISDDYVISKNPQYDGSSEDKAMICWIDQKVKINELFDELLEKSAEYRQQNLPPETEPDETTRPSDPTDITETTDPTDATDPTTTEEPTEGNDATTESSGADENPDDIENGEEDTVIPVEPEDVEEEYDFPEVPAVPVTPEEPEEGGEVAEGEEEALRSNASQAEGGEPVTPADDCYVVFKVTAGNMSKGPVLSWQGLHISKDHSFNFFDASIVPDHTLAPEDFGDLVEMPNIDFGSGFTAAQIAQMRSEQQKKIKDLDFQIKMADADYKIMQTEVSDGNIYSDIDGTVISVLTEEDAKLNKEPILKVSGGGGFYIEGSVNELDKDNLAIGQEVTVNDWRGGGTYTGTIQEVGDFPTRDDWNGMGNPNSSYYPFRVFVDESANLQAGSYVSVMYAAGTSENGIYLENPFVRTEQGKSYVMVQGQDGRLEKHFVATGKALWGSYTEILSGLTAEDKVAFPYGKNVKPGVAVQEGDLSNLYG